MWAERTPAWSRDPQHLSCSESSVTSSLAGQRTQSVLHTGNRNSGSGQIRGKTCEARRGPMAKPLMGAAGLWETALLRWRGTVASPGPVGPLLRVGWAGVCRPLARLATGAGLP